MHWLKGTLLRADLEEEGRLGTKQNFPPHRPKRDWIALPSMGRLLAKEILTIFSIVGIIAMIVAWVLLTERACPTPMLHEDAHGNDSRPFVQMPTFCGRFDNQTMYSCYLPSPGITLKKQKVAVPLIMGIGPAKTSSTALFEHYLILHPKIGIANSTYLETDCCGSETYFFNRFWEKFGRLGRSEKFADAFDPDLVGVSFVASKTPTYSAHPLVPYRIMATIEKPSIRLVFTLRNPVDAFISLYFYRCLVTVPKVEPSAEHFVAHVTNALITWNQDNACLKSVLLALGLDEMNSSSNPPIWPGVQYLDEQYFWTCYRQEVREGIADYFYQRNLIRWARLFNPKSIICVHDLELKRRPQAEVERILKFLGLHSSQELQELIDRTDARPSSVERVHELLDGQDDEVKSSVLMVLQKLNETYVGQLDFALNFCSTQTWQLNEEVPRMRL